MDTENSYPTPVENNREKTDNQERHVPDQTVQTAKLVPSHSIDLLNDIVSTAYRVWLKNGNNFLILSNQQHQYAFFGHRLLCAVSA